MVFRDQMLVCDQCGATFFFTVTEQRRLAEEAGGQDFEVPHLCPKCRQSKAEPLATSQASVDVKAEIEVSEVKVESAPAAIPAPLAAQVEPQLEPESEYEPEPELEHAYEPKPEDVSDLLPAFDESLLEDVGIKVKLIGRVKWFSRRKGFGFVTKADGEELFFHRSDVPASDIRQLKDGIQVDFQVRRTEKGLEAYDVTILPTP